MTLSQRIEASNPDAAYYKAWGLSNLQWVALSNTERVWFRSNVAKALQS